MNEWKYNHKEASKLNYRHSLIHPNTSKNNYGATLGSANGCELGLG